MLVLCFEINVIVLLGIVCVNFFGFVMLCWVVVYGMCGRFCFCSYFCVVFVLICNLFLFIFSNEKFFFVGFIGLILFLVVKFIR